MPLLIQKILAFTSLLILSLSVAADRNLDLHGLQQLAERERLQTVDGNRLNLRPTREMAGTVLVVSCKGCRHNREQERGFGLLLDSYTKNGYRVIEAPVPASSFPGDTLFPGDLLFPGDMLSPRQTGAAPGSHLVIDDDSAGRMHRALGISPSRHAFVFDTRGQQVLAGNAGDLVRYAERSARSTR